MSILYICIFNVHVRYTLLMKPKNDIGLFYTFANLTDGGSVFFLGCDYEMLLVAVSWLVKYREKNRRKYLKRIGHKTWSNGNSVFYRVHKNAFVKTPKHCLLFNGNLLKPTIIIAIRTHFKMHQNVCFHYLFHLKCIFIAGRVGCRICLFRFESWRDRDEPSLICEDNRLNYL